MSRLAIALVLFLAAPASAAESPVLWKDNDDLAVPEPVFDDEGEYQWWHDANSLSFYQAGKVLDVGKALRTVATWVGVAGPIEAANVNALDEVPDSTWFRNRHALRPLSAEALARGPADARPPDLEAGLTIVSGKGLGAVPGFVVRDDKGDRYLVKFDPVDRPQLATGTEQVCSRIVHALGWNVPDYHVARIDPDRVTIADDAEIDDEYGRSRPMLRTDLQAILARTAVDADGRHQVSMSRILDGEPKGPFRFEGVRADDANDTIPHEHRRDLRGFRVVAAWINHTDLRPENTLDVFRRRPGDPPGWGRLVHYFLDFGSALGSADIDWKHPRLGYEYMVDPPVMLANYLLLGTWVKPWEGAELTHTALGYLRAEDFDPESWIPEVPNPIFDRATFRDDFWGARLVASIRDEDLRVLVRTGRWGDPEVEELLFGVLRERRQRIARTWFDFRRIAPADGFRIDAEQLVWSDLSVKSGLVEPGRARYRIRAGAERSEATRSPRFSIPSGERSGIEVELEVSHDGGRRWSPPTRIGLQRGDGGGWRVVRVDRQVR